MHPYGAPARSTCMLARVLVGVMWLVLAGSVRAHDPGLSTGRIEIRSSDVVWTVAFAPTDAEWLLPLDQRGGDEARQKTLLGQKAGELLGANEDGRALVLGPTEVVVRPGDNVELQTTLTRGPGRRLTFTLRCFPALPAGHRHYVSVVSEAGELLAEGLLHARAPSLTVEAPAGVPPEARPVLAAEPVPAAAVVPPAPVTPRRSGFLLFFHLGVEHILVGYDHLLFLFGLLVVCTRWQTIAAIVTSFTIGHSLTLILATVGTVSLPGRVVEPAIAASIVVIALENLLRRGAEPRGRWWVTFFFGLVHGFGFATVLRDLGVAESPGGLLVPLAAFNLGVEAGQLLVAALVVPLLQWGRRRGVVTDRSVAVLSVLIGAAGLYWLVARTLLA